MTILIKKIPSQLRDTSLHYKILRKVMLLSRIFLKCKFKPIMLTCLYIFHIQRHVGPQKKIVLALT